MRLRGEALRLLHRQDQLEELLRTVADMRMIDLEDPDNEEIVEVMKDTIEGLLAGRYESPVPAHDPFSVVTGKVGEVNPIHWVRWTEARMKEAKRLRRIQCAKAR